MSAVSPRPALLREAENFTLFIKNSISFPRFKVNRFVGKEGRGAGGLKQLQPLSVQSPSIPAACTPETAALADLLEADGLGGGDTLEFLRVLRAEWSEHPPSWHMATTHAFHTGAT